MEEQNDDLFLYGGHPYYNPSNVHHANIYQQGSGHNMPPFYAIPHSQTHPNFSEHTFAPPNKMLNGNSVSPDMNTSQQICHNNHQKVRRPRIGSAGSNIPANKLMMNNAQSNSFISHQLAPPLGSQLGPTQTPHMPLGNGMNMPHPPLVPGQTFIHPPHIPIHHQPGVLPPPHGPTFMHPQPHPGLHPPPQLAQSRPNFYNHINSSFMFGPHPNLSLGPHHPPSHITGMIEHQSFYFPTPPSNSTKPMTKQRHDSVDSYLNKSNTNYQQVPQHMINNQQSNTNLDQTNNNNKNNYLLMPVPQNNSNSQPPLIQNTPSGASFAPSSLTKSHSYHSGISSYESHNQLVNPNSGVYVDVYQPVHQQPNAQNPNNSQLPKSGSLLNNNSLMTNGSQSNYSNNNISSSLDLNGLGYLLFFI